MEEQLKQGANAYKNYNYHCKSHNRSQRIYF